MIRSHGTGGHPELGNLPSESSLAESFPPHSFPVVETDEKVFRMDVLMLLYFFLFLVVLAGASVLDVIA